MPTKPAKHSPAQGSQKPKKLAILLEEPFLLDPDFYQRHYTRILKLIVLLLLCSMLLLLALYYLLQQPRIPDVYAVTLTGKLIPLTEGIPPP